MNIIRYTASRKLYLRSEESEYRGYLTFEDIADLVRLNRPFRVTDFRSGKDVTQYVLLKTFHAVNKKQLPDEATLRTLIKAFLC